MTKKIKIIGGSLGSLTAAAYLTSKGFEVTIIEKSTQVGGLYNNISTPFGEQELGMHVVYVSYDQLALLQNIFGENAFNVMTGTKVDVGGCSDGEKTSFSSLYPNFLDYAHRKKILNEIYKNSKSGTNAQNAHDELVNRFGSTAAKAKFIPAIEKLWKTEARLLTPESIHCFFDLRRIVVAFQHEALSLKSNNAALDAIIANPNQHKPVGKIHNGRVGITFKKTKSNLTNLVNDWCAKAGIKLQFNAQIKLENELILINGDDASNGCDACIIGISLYGLVSEMLDDMDKKKLSIYYFRLNKKIKNEFPSYYVLAHSPKHKVSRIVNYDEYSNLTENKEESILSAECIHEINDQPTETEIGKEIENIIGGLKIKDGFLLPKSIPVFSPTLNNKKCLDTVTGQISSQFKETYLYFSGMRTDTGTFFSHQTIGAAYDAALDIERKFS